MQTYHADGVEQDLAEVIKWGTKAAEQGNMQAQHLIAICTRPAKA
jgi:TPR repeat protein